MHKRYCAACRWWLVRDGDAEVFEGTQLIHSAQTCHDRIRSRPTLILLGREIRW